jgi:hypothetical protein
MQTGLIDRLIYVLIGLVFGMLILQKCTKPVEFEKIVEVIRVDTVFQNINPRPVFTLPKTLTDTIKVYDSIRVYQGRYTMPNGFFDYQFKTLGYLDSYEFRPSIISTNNTIIKDRPRFYGTISGGENIAAVGLIHVREKMIYGYRYNLATNSHDFTLGIRLY